MYPRKVWFTDIFISSNKIILIPPAPNGFPLGRKLLPDSLTSSRPNLILYLHFLGSNKSRKWKSADTNTVNGDNNRGQIRIRLEFDQTQ